MIRYHIFIYELFKNCEIKENKFDKLCFLILRKIKIKNVTFFFKNHYFLLIIFMQA